MGAPIEICSYNALNWEPCRLQSWWILHVPVVNLTKQAEIEILALTLQLHFTLKPSLCLKLLCVCNSSLSALFPKSFPSFFFNLYPSSVLIFSFIDRLITGQICFFPPSPGRVYLSKHFLLSHRVETSIWNYSLRSCKIPLNLICT